MKTLTTTLLVALCCFTSYAQQKLSVSGSVIDTSGTALGYASVMLLEPADSSLISYGLTNEKGEFIFKGVERETVLLKVTYVSYLPYQEPLSMPAEGDLNLEPIQVKPISKQLYEVVVKTAKAPISIKGDTIEYDASKFKVPPGSSLEELVRKLPGVQVDKDGNIIAQGEQVQKVTVDGRRFFGNNTKVATQNLNAEAVSKVQFFDDKSEQSKLTGVQDGVREKTMNVELKEEAKKGGFGKVTASAGTDNRWNANGLFNRFDKVNQFSIIGYGNNVNQSGLSWDDLQEFKGSGTSNMFGNQADFGFSANNGMMYIMFNNNEESFDIPFNDLSSGFSDNQAVGVNYNYLKNKKDLNSSYFFSRSNQAVETFENRTNLLENAQTFGTSNQSDATNLVGHHRLNLRFKNEIDSANSLVIIANGRYSNLATTLDGIQELTRLDNSTNFLQTISSNNKLSMGYEGIGVFRHKFKKNGRSLALSLTSTGSQADFDGMQKAVTDVVSSSDPTSYFRNLDQLNESINASHTLKSSVLFVEPVAESWYLETFYNFSKTNGDINREIIDVISDAANELNTDLSRSYTSEILYNRLGTSIRYSHKGTNISVGVAGLQYNLEGAFAVTDEMPLLGTIDRTFNAFTPNMNFNKKLKGGSRLGAGYSMGVKPPSLTDLQPFKDISNPLYVREGNPDLLPEYSHSVNLNYSMYDPATFIRFYSRVSATLNKNQIVQNQVIDTQTLVTTYTPGNVSGGEQYSGYFNFGFPIVKTKLSLSMNANLSLSNYISLLNSIENATNTFSRRVGLDLTLTPAEWLSFYTGGGFNNARTNFELNENQNQIILNTRWYANMNLKLPKEFYFDSRLDYNRYKNEKLNFDQQIPIWNAFLYKRIGENKKWEVRLSAYDILKRNMNIRQNASQNSVFYREVNTLSRYFLVGLTYNMRGVEIKNRRW
ncbi:outer membrane beta-barrel protein [Jiulongibacter sp. NS-SX5]|uniref:outer membrane beta-barrel protein n=1 Tax=Jiulongibacter sp. NS-SX5 TaxID=3463854 RepID=UPI004058BB6D